MSFWREPLLHFAVLGAGLFLLFSRIGEGDRPDEIVLTAGEIESLAEGWRRTWQRPPTRAELDGLIEDRITEEVLYREALALGLDRGDTIVRRRLRQKIEFLSDGLAGTADPSDTDLAAYLQQHAEQFRSEPRVSFEQVYVSTDRHGTAAREVAERLLAELARRADGAGQLGDPIALEPAFEALPAGEVAKLFGPEFVEQLLAASPGRWVGPIASGYGLHLVRVRERGDARDPSLAEVRKAVERAWREDRRTQAKADFVRRLRERYVVTVERPAWATAEVESATR